MKIIFLLLALSLTFFLSCDNSINTNSDEVNSALSDFYWTVQSGSSLNEVINDIEIDNKSNIYIVGYTLGDLYGTTNSGNKDIIILKYNDNGTLEWSRQIGTNKNEEAMGISKDQQNSIFIVGSTYGGLEGESHQGSSDIFILKYNELGAKQWSDQLGTNKIDYATSVSLDISGNPFLTGSTNRGLDSNSNAGDNKSDYFISKYDNSGNKQSTNQYGVTKDDTAYAIAIDGSGNLYVTGSTSNALDSETHVGNKDVFIVKFDASLNREWTKQIGTTSNDESYGVTYDSLGNIYVIGYTQGNLDNNVRKGTGNDKDFFILKYDENGNKIWSRQGGTDTEDIAYDVAKDSLDNIYIAGKTCSSLNNNNFKGACDYFLIKYNSSGTVQWTKQGGTSSEDIAKGVDIDSSNNIYITGYTYGSIDGNKNQGGTDYFLIKFNTEGFKQ